MLTEAETTTPEGEERELPAPPTLPAPPSFKTQFAATPRGAQLARRLAVKWLEERGYPVASDVTCAVALVAGELAANAVQHGRVPGRECGLRLTLDAAAGVVRVEVADAAAERRLPTGAPTSYPEGESGRGLLMVDVLAVRWGWEPRDPVGKTVWAELGIEPPTPPWAAPAPDVTAR
ncbi:ATP-binding protein [Streptomyces sp. NPDC059477]|uniref:ATP-binding protein n=1 Tax=Streptomyces sp. NPDC059477 TaxID=3346847 RepID=UPI0036CDBF90